MERGEDGCDDYDYDYVLMCLLGAWPQCSEIIVKKQRTIGRLLCIMNYNSWAKRRQKHRFQNHLQKEQA